MVFTFHTVHTNTKVWLMPVFVQYSKLVDSASYSLACNPSLLWHQLHLLLCLVGSDTYQLSSDHRIFCSPLASKSHMQPGEQIHFITLLYLLRTASLWGQPNIGVINTNTEWNVYYSKKYYLPLASQKCLHTFYIITACTTWIFFSYLPQMQV